MSDKAKKALLTVSLLAAERNQERPVEKQIELYEALANVLPDPEQRMAAERLAFALRETHALQQRFEEKCLHAKSSTSPEAFESEHKPDV